MKRYIILLFLIGSSSLMAQPLLPDSLRYAFQQATADSVKFKVSRAIYTFYEETNRDSALHYASFRYELAKKYKRHLEEAYTQGQVAYQQIYLGRFSEALTNLTEAIQIATDSKEADTWELTPFPGPGKNRLITLSMLNHMYGHLKLQTGSSESLHYFKEGRRIGLEAGNSFRVTVGDMVLSTNYLLLNQPDSALLYAREGERYSKQGGVNKYLAYIWSVMGDIYREKGMIHWPCIIIISRCKWVMLPVISPRCGDF
jgi:tetratricopeptide (TPR) repeat protein